MPKVMTVDVEEEDEAEVLAPTISEEVAPVFQNREEPAVTQQDEDESMESTIRRDSIDSHYSPSPEAEEEAKEAMTLGVPNPNMAPAALKASRAALVGRARARLGLI